MGVYKNTKWQAPPEGRSAKKVGCLILLIIVIGVGIWFFFFSRYFNIKTIIVEGATGNQKKEIEKLVQDKITKNKNLFSFPSKQTERELKSQFKNLAEVKIYKGPPDAVKIITIERKPMLMWQILEDNYIIDNYGVAYRNADDGDKKLPQIIDERTGSVKLGDKVLSTTFLNFINNLSKTFPKDLKTKITKIVVKDSIYEVKVYTDKDLYLIFDTSGSLEEQINDAKIAFDKIGNNKVEYFDLRVPGKVFYK